jgi:hypothetical protein
VEKSDSYLNEFYVLSCGVVAWVFVISFFDLLTFAKRQVDGATNWLWFHLDDEPSPVGSTDETYSRSFGNRP